MFTVTTSGRPMAHVLHAVLRRYRTTPPGDVGQLQLQVDGVTRSFAEWSAHYADTYYPRLGEQCYRVPAQHFNEQKLVSNESFRGVELGVPDHSKSFGDLAHTLVLEYFEEVGHRLQTRGSGPLFIISSVNYENYLAKLKIPEKGKKKMTAKGARGDDSRKGDKKTTKDDDEANVEVARPGESGVETGSEAQGEANPLANWVATSAVEDGHRVNADTCLKRVDSKMAAVQEASTREAASNTSTEKSNYLESSAQVDQSFQQPRQVVQSCNQTALHLNEFSQQPSFLLTRDEPARITSNGHLGCSQSSASAGDDESTSWGSSQQAGFDKRCRPNEENKKSRRKKRNQGKRANVQEPENHVNLRASDKCVYDRVVGCEPRTGQVVQGRGDSVLATTAADKQVNDNGDERLGRECGREDEGEAGEEERTHTDAVRAEEAIKVFPPRPRDMGVHYQRGDIDVVLISQQYGVVLVEVKCTGVGDSKWAESEEARLAGHRKVPSKASKQLERARHVFRFITPDITPPPSITLVIAFPFISRRQLQKILSTRERDVHESIHFLCEDDLKNRKWSMSLGSKLDELSRQQNENHLECYDCSWWDKNITKCTPSLPLDHTKSIVGRICGLMSIVSVWTQTTPRVEVRTTGQAVSEVGRRVADIVLLPEQAALLADTSCNRVCLTGPMGSGKTLLLQLKGRQWLAEGRRVVILNARTSGRGRAVGYALEEAIVRQDGESASTGTVERHDLAIAETSLEQLAAKLQESGSVEDICFILDELTKQTFDFVLQLTRRYPDCHVWCVAMFLHSPLQGFRHFRLGEVLRSPPSVQLLLRDLDLNPYHRHAYTTRSAARGLPCDGPPIILIQHRLHDPSTRPLHCHQCAIELADILQHTLGLALRVNDSGPQNNLPMTTTTRKSKPSAVEATPLSFRDVLLLVGMPVDAYRPVRGGHIQAGKEDVKKFCRHVLSSPFLTVLRERGLPVKPVVDNTSREIAIPSSDEIILTDVMGTHGLERKVVFFLPGGRLYEDMGRITDTQIQADGQCVLDDMLGGMMVAASPDPASPFQVSSESWPHRGGNTNSNAAAVRVRLGMEVRGDSPALTSLAAQDQTRTDAAILVPDVTDEVSRRTEEVERLREALDCLSMDDQDWLFIAAARCVAQFIFVVPCPER